MSIYSKIGPFKNVPEHARALAADRAEASARSALEAALREADDAGDTASDQDAIFQSERFLTDFDNQNITETGRRIKAARIVIAVITAIASVFWSLSLASAYEIWSALGTNGLGQIFALVTIVLVLSLLSFCAITLPALHILREIGKQGFIGDHLANALAVRGGTCWLIGGKALHIVDTTASGDQAKKSVFYDAIGCAKVRMDNTLEAVDLYSRNGCRIASIVCPAALSSSPRNGITARDVAGLLTRTASDSRHPPHTDGDQ